MGITCIIKSQVTDLTVHEAQSFATVPFTSTLFTCTRVVEESIGRPPLSSIHVHIDLKLILKVY